MTALLNAGANVSAKARGAAQPLHFAALNNQPAAAALLIQGGAQVDALNSQQMTPLMLAATNDAPDVAKVLIDAGADLTGSNPRATVAQYAAASGSVLVVKLLLSKGVDVNARSKDTGETMLFAVSSINWEQVVASSDQRLAMIAFLLDNGADPNIVDDNGETVLDFASKDSYDPGTTKKVRALLIAHGAKPGSDATKG